MARYNIRDRGNYATDGTPWFRVDTPALGEPAERLDIVHVFTPADLVHVAEHAACHLAVSGFIESDDDTVHRAGILIARSLRSTTPDDRPDAAAPDDRDVRPDVGARARRVRVRRDPRRVRPSPPGR